MTDRRTYNLDLVSSPTEFIPSVRFDYPDDAVGGWDVFIAGQRKANDALTLSDSAHRLSPENLRFDYSLSAKNAPWKPVRVFDDGVKTYIEMPKTYSALEAPILMFYEGSQMKLVNYRVKGSFYVADRIMSKKAALIAGKTKIVIERKGEAR
jgi:type IV secretion system protein VirB9